MGDSRVAEGMATVPDPLSLYFLVVQPEPFDDV